jgi:ubiquinone/menaquinone biosynthesis C-methylase UbiE
VSLKEHQRHHFDHEVHDPEFEIVRPRSAGRFYSYLMHYKVRTAVELLSRDLSNQRVLVICAGSGMDAELLLSHGVQVVALDISEGALGRARERALRFGLRFGLVAGDAEALPFADGAFDHVFVHDGLHHLDDVEGAIGEMVRVGQRGVMITEPADAMFMRALIRVGLLPATEDSGNEVYRLHPNRVTPLLTRLGMPVVRHRRYLVKYSHQPGPLFRLLDLPLLYPLARVAFRLFGVRLLGAAGNKLTIVAERADQPIK